jgi:Flp pilus assembly pilin Flp
MIKLSQKLLAAFVADEKGLVTIEWVGIAAVVVVAGIVITTFIMQGASDLGGDIGGTLDNVGSDVSGVTIPDFTPTPAGS